VGPGCGRAMKGQAMQGKKGADSHTTPNGTNFRHK
jgi:hypothetical protein